MSTISSNAGILPNVCVVLLHQLDPHALAIYFRGEADIVLQHGAEIEFNGDDFQMMILILNLTL